MSAWTCDDGSGCEPPAPGVVYGDGVGIRAGHHEHVFDFGLGHPTEPCPGSGGVAPAAPWEEGTDYLRDETPGDWSKHFDTGRIVELDETTTGGLRVTQQADQDVPDETSGLARLELYVR